MNLLAVIVRLHHALTSRARNAWYRALGVRMSGYVWMRRCSIPRNWGDITLEGNVSLDDHVTLLASGDASLDKIVVGADTYINRGTMIDAHSSVRIGPRCMIGPFCYITDSDHGTGSKGAVAGQPMEISPVRIGAEVWLGAGVKVLKGVTIGDGAVIGAGAVVTHDVPAGAIAAGVPARVIGQRGAAEFMTGSSHSATIVITTRNRKEELRNALRSALSQDFPAEVIVTDDASDDGTAEMVREEFPSVKMLRSEQCLGLITQRNRAAAVATGSIIFSIDDDAEFGSADTVRKTLAEFSDERVGAVAIPHKDTVTNKIVNPAAPDDGRIWCVAAYTGTAHAVRRDLFLRLGGYREDLVHQGEESDYCMRMLAAGRVTRLGRAPLIQHHESPRRSFARMDFHGRRNDILFAWRHAPFISLVPHLLGTSLHGVRDAASTGRWKTHGSGILEGWRMIARGAALREPVLSKVYKAFRMLRRHGPKPIEEILPLLPPLA